LPLDPRDAPVYNASLAEQLAATFPQKPNAAPTGISPQPPSTTAIQQTAVEQAKPIVKAPVQGTPSTAAIPLGKRVALVIGNDEYESLPDLKRR
jgi:hypothetical protein